MKYTCWNDLCIILEDCDCESECCSGEIASPMVIQILSDYEIKTNNPNIEYEVSERDIQDLCLYNICPFCNSFVEA